MSVSVNGELSDACLDGLVYKLEAIDVVDLQEVVDEVERFFVVLADGFHTLSRPLARPIFILQIIHHLLDRIHFHPCSFAHFELPVLIVVIPHRFDLQIALVLNALSRFAENAGVGEADLKLFLGLGYLYLDFGDGNFGIKIIPYKIFGICQLFLAVALEVALNYLPLILPALVHHLLPQVDLRFLHLPALLLQDVLVGSWLDIELLHDRPRYCQQY